MISHNCKCHRFVCTAISIKSMLCCLDRIILNKIIIHLRQCHCFRVIMNEMIFATKLNCPIEIIAMPIIKWIQRYIYICCILQWKHPFHSNQFPIKCSTDWNIWHNSDKLCSLLLFFARLVKCSNRFLHYIVIAFDGYDIFYSVIFFLSFSWYFIIHSWLLQFINRNYR